MKIDYNKAINYSFVIYALLLPLSRASVSIFTILITLFWILDGNLKNKFSKIIKCKFLTTFLIFIAFSAISLFWVDSEHLYNGLDYIKKYWYLLPMVALYTSIQKEYIKYALNAFLIGLAIHAILSLSIFFDIGELKETTQHGLSPYMHHVMYSFYLAFGALTAINFAINENINYKKKGYIFLFILYVTILFLGIGRTGQFIFIITLIILLLKNSQNRLKSLSITLFTIFSLIIILYTTNSTFKDRINHISSDIKQIENKQYCNSLGGRVFTWELAYDVFKKEPFLGLGVGDHLAYLQNAMHVDKRFKDCDFKGMIKNFHGQYIEILAQVGIIGEIIFLMLFFWLNKIKFTDKFDENQKFITFLTFLLFFIVDKPLTRQFGLAIFVFSISIILSKKRILNEN